MNLKLSGGRVNSFGEPVGITQIAGRRFYTPHAAGAGHRDTDPDGPAQGFGDRPEGAALDGRSARAYAYRA